MCLTVAVVPLTCLLEINTKKNKRLTMLSLNLLKRYILNYIANHYFTFLGFEELVFFLNVLQFSNNMPGSNRMDVFITAVHL